MTRPLATLALTGLVGLAAAGCGSGSSSTTTSDGRPASSAAAPAPTKQEKAVKFAECVRAHGYAHFPDPDAKGEFGSFAVDVSPAIFTRAVGACKALQPPGSLSSKRTPKEQSASLKFARCVRAKGVRDFPDPVQGEPIIDTTKIPSTDKPGGMTILNAATSKCTGILKLSAGGQGG